MEDEICSEYRKKQKALLEKLEIIEKVLEEKYPKLEATEVQFYKDIKPNYYKPKTDEQRKLETRRDEIKKELIDVNKIVETCDKEI
jgi:hypothetical protein